MQQKFCLNSVSSSRQISFSPLNTSKSKQLFSFSKDYRFKQPKIYCDNIYNIPSPFIQSGVNFRSAKKQDYTFESRNKTKSNLDMHRKSRRGLSMYQNGLQENRYKHVPLYQGPTFTMRKKLAVIDRTMSIQSQNDNPGAGRYQNPEALSPNGRYYVGKHKSTGYTRFNPRSSQRFFEFKNLNPGPGNYEQINNLDKEGHYSLSQSQGFGKRAFDKERRVVLFQQKAKKNYNPAPGAYRAPSDFGHYDGDVYQKTGGISYINGNNFQSRRSSRSRF